MRIREVTYTPITESDFLKFEVSKRTKIVYNPLINFSKWNMGKHMKSVVIVRVRTKLLPT